MCYLIHEDVFIYSIANSITTLLFITKLNSKRSFQVKYLNIEKRSIFKLTHSHRIENAKKYPSQPFPTTAPFLIGLITTVYPTSTQSDNNEVARLRKRWFFLRSIRTSNFTYGLIKNSIFSIRPEDFKLINVQRSMNDATFADCHGMWLANIFTKP